MQNVGLALGVGTSWSSSDHKPSRWQKIVFACTFRIEQRAPTDQVRLEARHGAAVEELEGGDARVILQQARTEMRMG